jgi:NADH-quinone oxidoreductase subunit M
LGDDSADNFHNLDFGLLKLMTTPLLSLLIFLPIAAALIGLFLPSSKKNAFRYLAISTNIVQLILLVIIVAGYNGSEGAFRLAEHYSWISLDLGTWGYLQADYFLGLDGLSLPMIALSVFILFIATLSSWTIDKNVKGYFVLLLILNGAIIGSFCALDFLLFYVFFEFMLLPMYFLIGIWGGPRREYASIKFFLYTLIGSIFILIVMIALYISMQDSSSGQLAHTFNLLHIQNPDHYISGSILNPLSENYLGPFTFRSWAFLLLFFGFAIKLPLVPFHTWLPDAHVEAPTPISIILAALLLKVGAYGLARIVWPIFPNEVVLFNGTISFLAVLAILYGALNAMASKDLKRLIAYSSVSHMGFVLLGFVSGTPEGISGAVYQMFSHGIISAMLFVLAGVLYDRTQDRLISNYSGLSSSMPVYFSFILIAFFAGLGLPGFSGFIAEVMIFLGAFKSASTNQLVPTWVAIVSTMGLILGASYFVWTIQRMFFGKLSIKPVHINLVDISRQEYLILLPLASALLFFGIFPQPLLDVINPFAQQLADLISLFTSSQNP